MTKDAHLAKEETDAAVVAGSEKKISPSIERVFKHLKQSLKRNGALKERKGIENLCKQFVEHVDAIKGDNSMI